MNTRPENIAGFRIVRLLGKGGMSEVYEAENIRLGSRHALKLYSYPKDVPDVRTRFETEGRLLAKLNHPRIVKVVDFGVDGDGGRPYFVMDLVRSPDGTVKSLADVHAGEADEKEIGRWYDDIRDGLAYIHGKGVVHRDLKLQNILIGPDGHAVITDFGISKIFEPADGGDTIVDPVQTIVRMQDGKAPLMGSLGYMAPELEMGVAATERSDWYALGVMVFRLLTGTWCDARTDVVEMLSSYDPVWKTILPGLLHSNPEGRKCLSYAEEMELLGERSLIAEEKKVEDILQRMRKLRRVAVAAVSVLTLITTAALCLNFVSAKERERLSAEMREMREKMSIPGFHDVFSVPEEAGDEEMDGMPSRAQFEAARVDALVLTSEIFSDMKTGAITAEKAASMLADLAERAKNDDLDLFSGVYETYSSSGETLALSMLLESAVKRLK